MVRKNDATAEKRHRRLEFRKDLAMLASIVLMLVAGSTFVGAHNEVEAVRTTAFQALTLLETEIARETPPPSVSTPTVIIPGYTPPQQPEQPGTEGLPQHVLEATTLWKEATRQWSLIAMSEPGHDDLAKLDATLNAGFAKLGLPTQFHLADMLPNLVRGIHTPLKTVAWATLSVAAGAFSAWCDSRQHKHADA